MSELYITRPDDWHVHLRDGAAMASVVQHSAKQFARCIVMPNLSPPITTVDAAECYYKRIQQYIPKAHRSGTERFQPLMTLYLTDNTAVEEIKKAHNSSFIHAVKYYPAGATTNSDSGVTDLKHCFKSIATMEELGLPLLMHGEVTDPNIDIFDREQVFIERHLQPLLLQFPALKVVFEHITTKHAADFVLECEKNVAATITPQHLLYNRNDMLVGGIRPHFYCLPVLKRETHRQALIKAATSGNAKFFLGTDSAPHAQGKKETACGCAGMYSAHAAIELYATAFEQANALDKLEGFASHFGADFYGLERNQCSVTLRKQSWTIPDFYPLECAPQADTAHNKSSNNKLIPMLAGQTINWKLE